MTGSGGRRGQQFGTDTDLRTILTTKEDLRIARRNRATFFAGGSAIICAILGLVLLFGPILWQGVVLLILAVILAIITWWRGIA